MIRDSTLRDHSTPVRHVCVVSEGKDADLRKLGREEVFRPRLVRAACGPRLVTVAGQTVDEDYTAIGGSPQISYQAKTPSGPPWL
jgi:hypothetical protein